jgi:hypothetical protein
MAKRSHAAKQAQPLAYIHSEQIGASASWTPIETTVTTVATAAQEAPAIAAPFQVLRKYGFKSELIW